MKITAAYNDIGGAARIATDITHELRRASVQVSVYAGIQHGHDPDVHIIKKRFDQRLLSRLGANDIEFFSTDYLLDTEDFQTADVVHAHNLHGWYFNLNTLKKMSERKPVVWTLHDMWAVTSHCAHTSLPLQSNGFYTCEHPDTYPKLLWNNRAHLEQIKSSIYEQGNFSIVCPSDWLQKKVAPSALGKHSVHLIHNGIDAAVYQKSNKQLARQKLGLPLDKKIVLFVASGGITNVFKGGDVVRGAATTYKDATNVLFVCVGGTENVREDNILHVQGVHEKNQLTLWYSAADVFLFTSRAENFPLVVLEAMSCELPVVSFAVGGVAEAVEHGKHGYIAEYLNQQDLCAGIDYVLNQTPEAYTAMAQACREAVLSHFTVSHMTTQYLNLYRSLLKTRAR